MVSLPRLGLKSSTRLAWLQLALVSVYNPAEMTVVRRHLVIVFLLTAVGLMVGSDEPTAPSQALSDLPTTDKAVTATDNSPVPDGSSEGRTMQTAAPSGANVAIIRIEGMIYGFTFESLQRRVDRALDQGASLIVLELDTPGGTVDTALEISRYIKGKIPVPTLAWINSKAYSAGIMIAAACNEIVMSKASVTGDCAPIVPGTNLAPTERLKALSPILAEFEDSATRNQYDYPLFHAMCELGVEVYLIKHPDTEDRRLVNRIDYQIMVKGATMEEASTEPTIASSSTTQPSYDVGTPSSELSSTQTAEHRGKWILVKQIHDGRTLLTLSQTPALEIELAKSIVQTELDLKTYTGAANVVRIEQSWSEDLAGWLVHPMVRMVLILALLLGAYAEFQTPGVGIAGAVALLALITLLGAPFLVGLAEIWHLVVFFIGFCMLMVEVFVTPGFGLLGAAGFVCMLTGLVLAVVPTRGGGPMPLPAPEMLRLLQNSVLSTLLAIIASGVGFYFLTKYLGSIPLVDKLVLYATSGGNMQACGEPTTVSGDEAIGRGKILAGAKGRVIAGLRPSGRAEIEGQAVDVVSQGAWIERGSLVRVVEVHGNRVVVEALET